jgi:tRNA pseudouridine38-40 synthase
LRTIRLTIAYDGTALVGWQRQARGVSVQKLLEEALARIDGGAVCVVGAGRTDAGVHASAQVASATVATSRDTQTLRRALNAMLPAAVRVVTVDDAAEGFHARHHARTKTYRYRILNAPSVPPFVRQYVWHVPRALDATLMNRAARELEGEHDFAAFQSTGSGVRRSTRILSESRVNVMQLGADRAADLALIPRVAMPDARLLVYVATGTGFLRHMVRTIVGTLVEIGSGRQPPDLIAHLLEQRDRAAAGPTAPAGGLCLEAVDYDG